MSNFEISVYVLVRTPELGRKPSPLKDQGECHNKLMPAAGMLQCDIFISNERQKRQINKMFDLR